MLTPPTSKAIIDQTPDVIDDEQIIEAMLSGYASMSASDAAQFTAMCQAEPLDFEALAGWLKSHGYL